MKKRLTFFFIIVLTVGGLFIIYVVSSLGVNDKFHLLRYAGSFCVGYFGSSKHNQGRYSFPIDIYITHPPIKVYLSMYNIAQFNFQTTENQKIFVYSEGVEQNSKSTLYDLGIPLELKRIEVLEHLRGAIIHPTYPQLAGIYEENDIAGSNLIGVFNLDSLGSEPTFFELNDTNIKEIADWSTNGRILAVIQYTQFGQTPYYLFIDDGTILESQFATLPFGCVKNAMFAPQGETLVYSGTHERSEGWDIFWEKISDNPSLLNLTNTPQEDEVSPAWSFDGKYVVYVKGYKDHDGIIRQELFLIDMQNSHFSAVQLTDSKTSFETNPYWVSEHKIAYFNWLPQEERWELMSIDIENNAVDKVMDIPTSWYKLP